MNRGTNLPNTLKTLNGEQEDSMNAEHYNELIELSQKIFNLLK